MNDWRQDIQDSVAAFLAVAAAAHVPLTADELEIEFLHAPHRPPTRLPLGKMAIYAFWGDDCWLKIGMAGPKSAARYTSQHYNAGSAPSTLAASLIKWTSSNPMLGFYPDRAGEWLRGSCHRANILMASDQPRELLALMEAFLHLRLRPRHER